MRNCAHYERNLSTWLDEGLGKEQQIDALDHVVRCELCRRFYADARTLDGLIATVRTPRHASTPPPEMWKRIEQSARHADPVKVAIASAWFPGWRAAAAVVLAVGLGVVFMSKSEVVTPTSQSTEIQLSENAGQMSEARFMELATEVLRAEPRFHWAMYDALDQVLRETGTREASHEYYRSDETADDAIPKEAFNRNPA